MSGRRLVWLVVLAGFLGIGAARAAGDVPAPNRVDAMMDLVEATDLAGAPPSDTRTASTDYQLYLTLLHEYRMKQEANRVTECILLSVTLVATLAAVLGVLLWRPPHSTALILNAAGLVLVVFATVFIVVLADAEQQLTAAMGILGAIVGYLFGSMRRPHPEPPPSTVPKEVP
ncbi:MULTISPECIES: hypothetical protein [Deferrisoma]